VYSYWKRESLSPEFAARICAEAGLTAVVDVAKRWIESEFAEPVEKVVEIALPFTRVGA
jgi:hypothetical protein